MSLLVLLTGIVMLLQIVLNLSKVLIFVFPTPFHQDSPEVRLALIDSDGLEFVEDPASLHLSSFKRLA